MPSISAKNQARCSTQRRPPAGTNAGVMAVPGPAWYLQSEFRPAVIAGLVLTLSGIAHAIGGMASAETWSGSVSWRKPALFGLSSGATLLSLVWVLAQLPPRTRDGRASTLLAATLVGEVSLITFQFWRGSPSHFNRATPIDAAIELLMALLILLATLGIVGIWLRLRELSTKSVSRSLAIRAGMAYLVLSCGLGFVAAAAGEWNLSQGLPPETWGRAGVLKFPHGAALHAIQVLPAIDVILSRWPDRRRVTGLWIAITMQGLFLLYAVGQTLLGRARFDFAI